MRKEIIFMHIPKTAGKSMRSILNTKNVTIIDHNLRNPNYIYLRDYVKNKKNTFIFTFVRNPWDRLVSSFFYLNEGGNCQGDEEDRKKYLEKYNKDFTLFVKEAFKTKDILEQIHFMPQHKYISDSKGNLLPEFIGKQENLKGDMKKIEEKIKIELGEIPHINKSKHKNYKEYYNEETKEIVRKVYKKDIELFGYDF